MIKNIIKFETCDDFYGIVATIRVNRKKYTAPFYDLEGLDKESQSARLIKDYSIWFLNSN